MNFRRCILAMAMLALFAGLASAQVSIGGASTGPLNCIANPTVPLTLRSEGMTEQIGDILITCTGGNPAAPGSTVPTVNITVSLATSVTSRLISSSSAALPINTSEALLLVDEPSSATAVPPPGFTAGPAAPPVLCGNSAVGAGPGGCFQSVSTGIGAPAGQSCTGAAAACTAAVNVFQGLVSGNQVTFLGVPINPPVSAGVGRTFRITNVRANVSALGGGGLPGTSPIYAFISASGILIGSPQVIVGSIQSGLSTSIRSSGAPSDTAGALSLAQCGGGGPSALRIVRFSENFPTAFKTRVVPAADGTGGQGTGAPTQSQTGGTYITGASESGMILPVSGGLTAGLADYGTRLKATFNNVPAGVRLFVSTTNVSNAFTTSPFTGTSPNFAQLVLSETAPEGQFGISNATVTYGSTTINIAEIPVNNGTATAVWEVIKTNPNAIETSLFDFAVYTQFTANPGANTPPPGTSTVNLSYAPTPPVPFTAAAGATASSSLTIPRFADTSSGSNIFSIALCQTVLLFPYVVNVSGFDTGMAIANTTTDPFGTRVQNGTCDLNFYGTAAPPKVTTPNIPTATVYATLASTAAAGFNGYMIAVCNFQLAHGFAFISDIGARNLAMGYLALVVQTGTGNRNSGSLGGALPNSIEILGN